MTPQRIQRKRTKGYRMPEGAVYVGRPSKWANPYGIGYVVSETGLIPRQFTVESREQAVGLFARWLHGDVSVARSGYNLHRSPPALDEIRAELAGKNLACWCSLDQPWCHATELLRVANGGAS